MTQAEIAYEDKLNHSFPTIDPGVKPFGSRVVVQFRTPKLKSAGGIVFTAETRDTELWNTQVAKLIAVGPLAFKSREKMTDWPEGVWAEQGEFVRVSKHGGDKWLVPIPDREKGEEAIFAVLNDLDLIGKITGDPLAMKAFI